MVTIYLTLLALAASAAGDTGDWNRDWEAAGHAVEKSWIQFGSQYGLWIFGALIAFVLVRGLLRTSRYLAAKNLTDGDREMLRERVATAESKTSGEIVVVVAHASDDHPDAPWKAGAVTLLVGTLLVGGFAGTAGTLGFFFIQLGIFGLGYFMGLGLNDFRRCFLREGRATEVCEEEALQELQRLDLTSKPERSAVLLFVSVFEQRVVILGGTLAHEAAGEDAWVKADAAVLQALRANGPPSETLRDALAKGIDTIGEVLAEALPPTDDDSNRFEDSVNIRS